MEAKVFDGPIWIQARLVSKYFEETIQASYTIRDADKIEHRIVYNWPLAAFEELATNCILHKRYESPNYIGIYVYSDRITFVNHNRPMQLEGQEYATNNKYGNYFLRFVEECRFALGEDENGKTIDRVPRKSRYIKSEDILYEIKKIQ